MFAHLVEREQALFFYRLAKRSFIHAVAAADLGFVRHGSRLGVAFMAGIANAGLAKAASMLDSAEVCGCNGVNKGTICKAIKEKGLFTLDEVRKHTKASAHGFCFGCG